MLNWFRKKNETPKAAKSPAERLLTLKAAEIYYLPITKCGSTYLKNVFYYLDAGEEHYSGLDIHNNYDDLVKASPEDEDKIRNSPYAFTVLRHPVDRFTSLYFDKIWGDGTNNFSRLRLSLQSEIDIDLGRELSVETHRENCRKFILWLERNMNFETDEPVNPHWRRQARRVKRTASLDLVHLTLDGLDWQLPMLVGKLVPDISDAMEAVREKNRSPKPFKTVELMDAALRNEIERVYAVDLKLYKTASDYWNAKREG